MDTRTLDYEKIAAFIGERRRERQLTQRQLAELLGVTDRAVSKWETGKSFPDVSLLLPLCETLGISTSEFFSGELKQKTPLSREEEGELVVRGIRGYLVKMRVKLLTGWATAGLLLMVMVLFGSYCWYENQPVDFASGDFPIGMVRVQRYDHTTLTLKAPNRKQVERIKALLRDFVIGEPLESRKELIKSESVEISGVGTFYFNGYYDEKNKKYYGYTQNWFSELSRMVENYALASEYAYSGATHFDFGDREVQLSATIEERPQEQILNYFCELITVKDIEEGVYTKSINLLSIEKIADDDAFQSFDGEQIQKEIAYYDLYDYEIYQVISEREYTEKKRNWGPQVPEGKHRQVFLIGDRGDGYEVFYASFPSPL